MCLVSHRPPMVAAGLCLGNPPAWPPAEPAAWCLDLDAWRVARVSCAAAAGPGCLGRGPRCLVCSYLLVNYCSACSYLLPGQLQLLQLFAAWSWLPGGCRALPGPWSACLVPVATGRPGRAAAAWCLVLVPVAAWPCLCLCSWSPGVCDPVPRFTNIRAARPGPRSVARGPGCLVRGHRPARPGA